MVAAAGSDWTVERHPLEVIVDGEAETRRVPVP
jgi:hypothetical protein